MMEADGRIGPTLENVKIYAKIYTLTLSWDKYFSNSLD